MLGTGTGIVLAMGGLGLALSSSTGCESAGGDCVRLGTCIPGEASGVGGGVGAGGEGAGAGGDAEGGSGGEGGGQTPSCTPDETPMNGGCLDDGVFVRLSGDDTADGSKDAPFATLTHAVEVAVASGKVVYACAEIFDEEVEVPAGVTLYGGLDCDDDWTWQPAVKTTVAPATAGAVPLVLLASDPVGAQTTIQDVAFIAPDATEPGQSSIAAQARQASQATLQRCLFQAGAGAPGATGEDAPSSPPPAAPAGNNGAPGYCSDFSNTAPAGGAMKVNSMCFAPGGKGGNGAQAPSTTGTAGWNGAPTGSGTGIGGPPQPTSGGWSCPNIHGAKGNDGGAGEGASAVSFVTPEGAFSGSVGQPGTPGGAGIGGGGGGGRLSISCPGYFYATGPGGGSGGPGGCGGAAGGGSYGGSSIAIVSINAELTLIDSEIVAGDGGSGGNGGAGQGGATGGAGGQWGGSSTAIPIGCFTAGDGGKGGDGGAGGPGGGGSGGYSVAIVHVGTAPTLTGATLQPGTAGMGGNGGPESGPTSVGAAGTAAPLLEMMML